MKHYSLSTRVASFIFLGCSLLMCTKKDQLATLENEPGAIEKKFFTTNRTQNDDERVLVDYLIRQQQKNKFVEKTVAQIGYPRWDKMITVRRKGNGSGKGASDSTGTTYYIPFVRDTQQYVNASMIINTTASDTSFGYRCDWEYAQRQNSLNSVSDSAEYHAIFFMVLDKAVFGYTEFEITDTSLFKQNNLTPLKIKLNDLPTGNKNNDYSPVQVCQETIVTWQNCPYPRGQCGGPNGTCDNCHLCTDSGPWTYCWTTWIVGGSGFGNTGGAGLGSSVGGGGNNGGSSPTPCPGTTSSQRGQTVTPGCDPGWSVTPPADPCLTAQPAINSLNTLFQNSTVANAIASIHAQDPTIEHSISLGRDANGNITASSITPGGTHSGTVNTNWPGGFADVHNHPSNNEPSPGDLYMIMGLCRSKPGWNTKILSNRNGETYAFVVVDTAAAKTFRDNSFTINPTYGPVFSNEQFAKVQIVSEYFQQQGYSRVYSNERALAYILDKYNSGVILLKKEGTTFMRLRTSAGPQNGTYDSNDCY